MCSRTVLIVEDEPLIRMMLAEALCDEGYSVIEAGTALEAMAVLGINDVSAVVTDIDMPGGLSGLDLTRYVASCRKGLPVIVTSGGHLLREEELPGGTRFLAKPYQLRQILDMLLEAVAAGASVEANVGRLRVA
ncbi:response regulator [Pararhizobium arenae]|uniref:response regulator n=1 Tax=Pararhizobium arenae TaxID=1856850 RepID=UPI00094B1AB3|nr:response regulator [Pararhizobium arenae]